MRDGTWQIKAGPPKKRDPFPKVAKDCETLLYDSIDKYQSNLRDKAQIKAEEREKQKAQLFLGSYSEKTINLYQELQDLEALLAQTKESILQQ